uniref:Cilia and flagella associated protein 298 n=1 Tax=Hippocampus comes TaxID=109280 RepID=A0A3Q2Z6E7_HIPCM
MVILHVKRGDESHFLFSAGVQEAVDVLVRDITAIFNGRLKVGRICAEMAELAEHGVTLPPNMQGLTDEQLVDLKLKDEWEDKCVPSGGAVFKKDDIGRRNGHETSGSQRVRDHGHGEGSPGTAAGGRHDRVPHGAASSRPHPHGA